MPFAIRTHRASLSSSPHLTHDLTSPRPLLPIASQHPQGMQQAACLARGYGGSSPRTPRRMTDATPARYEASAHVREYTSALTCTRAPIKPPFLVVPPGADPSRNMR